MEALKLRRQIKAALPLVNRKVKLLESFLKKDFIYDPLDIELPEQYLDINPALFLPSDVNPGEWAKASYQKGRFYKNDIKHYTEGGIVTRSKSEAMIGTELERRGLIFRYEPALRVGNETKYPDFVIIHPVTRRLIYWEHFGKVDDADYIKKNLRRMNLYSRNGIYLGINFVMTFETRDEPLTIKAINDKIDEILAMC